MRKIFIKFAFLVLVGLVAISCTKNANKDSNAANKTYKQIKCSDIEKLHKSTGVFKQNVSGFIFMIRTGKQNDKMTEGSFTENELYESIPPQLNDSDINALKNACEKYQQDLKAEELRDDDSEDLFTYRFREENSSCIIDEFTCHLDSNKKVQRYEIITYQEASQTYHFSDFLKPECKSLINLDNSDKKSSVIDFKNKTACQCIIKTYGNFIRYSNDECDGKAYKLYHVDANKKYYHFSSLKDLLNLEITDSNILYLEK